ncbi:RHS repeat protein [Alloalcanivorax xenomutans]|uniref:RHS repeat domain-containing protein n=1 Tax=Alloalcanivorax xenomutans TaxID=1094342 RepID=UPI003A7FD01A
MKTPIRLLKTLLGLTVLLCGLVNAATYSYDALGRVTAIQYENGTQVTYQYDAMGNRTEVAVVQGDEEPEEEVFVSIITIRSAKGRPAINLRSLANKNGYDGTKKARITFVVLASYMVRGSEGTASFPNGGVAIDTGTWPKSLKHELTLRVWGKVYGGGGAGADAVFGTSLLGGGKGGTAIVMRSDLDVIIESRGEVKAGGGGGGSGAGTNSNNVPPLSNPWYNAHGGGGGGGGFPNGKGGDASTVNLATSGGDGTISGGGQGGKALKTGRQPTPYGRGGNGGGAGQAGARGQTSWDGRTGGAGGAPGAALVSNGNNYTLTNRGVLVGARR